MSRIPLFTRGIVRNQPFWVYFLIALGVQYGVSFGFAVATWAENYRWVPSPVVAIWDFTIAGTGALIVAYLTNSLEVLVYGYRPFMHTIAPPNWVITLNLILLGIPIAIILSLFFAWHCRQKNRIARITLIVLLLLAFANSAALWDYRNSLMKIDGYWSVHYTYPSIAVAAARDDLPSVEKMIGNGADMDCLDEQGHTLLYRLFTNAEYFSDPSISTFRGLSHSLPISIYYNYGSDDKPVEAVLLQNGAVFNASDLVEFRKRLESFTNVEFSDEEWSQFLSMKSASTTTKHLALLIALDNAWDESDDEAGIIERASELNYRFSFGGVNNRTPLHFAVYLDSVFAVGRLISTPLLLNAGADPSLKDDSGETAFDLAMRIWPEEKKEVVKNWLKKGHKPEGSGK